MNECVFLKPHRHGGNDYKVGDTASIDSATAEKLVNRGIVKLNQPVKKEGKAE